MSQYVLGHEAALDLEAIWEFIAQDKPDAADRWISQLFDAFERLAANPGIGHKREDLTDHPVFFWPVGEYLILYRDSRDSIEIIAVTQGSRDIPRLLSHRGRQFTPDHPPVTLVATPLAKVTVHVFDPE